MLDKLMEFKYFYNQYENGCRASTGTYPSAIIQDHSAERREVAEGYSTNGVHAKQPWTVCCSVLTANCSEFEDSPFILGKTQFICDFFME